MIFEFIKKKSGALKVKKFMMKISMKYEKCLKNRKKIQLKEKY